jgi:hypothetical protein
MKTVIFLSAFVCLGLSSWWAFSNRSLCSKRVKSEGLVFEGLNKSIEMERGLLLKYRLSNDPQASIAGRYFTEYRGEESILENFTGFGHSPDHDVKILHGKENDKLWLVLFQRNGGQVVVYGKFVIKKGSGDDESLLIEDLPVSFYGVPLADFSGGNGLLYVSGCQIIEFEMLQGKMSIESGPDVSEVFSTDWKSSSGRLTFSK